MLNATAVDSPSPASDAPRHRPRKPRCKRRRSAVGELRIALDLFRLRLMQMGAARSDAVRISDLRGALGFCQGYVSGDYPELAQLLKQISDIGAPDAVGGAK